jgi:FixJ family two-component response regulator
MGFMMFYWIVRAVMSSQDSIGTVLKCMQNGAVDFLVKPVRKNELRNLWQHVWRRHSVSRHSSRLSERFLLQPVLWLAFFSCVL